MNNLDNLQKITPENTFRTIAVITALFLTTSCGNGRPSTEAVNSTWAPIVPTSQTAVLVSATATPASIVNTPERLRNQTATPLPINLNGVPARRTTPEVVRPQQQPTPRRVAPVVPKPGVNGTPVATATSVLNKYLP